ncbi:MAG: hypothetical protein QW829_03510 [Candidatus Bathyarchaeia archaeon]
MSNNHFMPKLRTIAKVSTVAVEKCVANKPMNTIISRILCERALGKISVIYGKIL